MIYAHPFENICINVYILILYLSFLLPVKSYLPLELQVTAPKGSTKVLTGVTKKVANTMVMLKPNTVANMHSSPDRSKVFFYWQTSYLQLDFWFHSLLSLMNFRFIALGWMVFFCSMGEILVPEGLIGS